MKNILLISFALVFIGGCDKSSNPVAADTSCNAGGCTATGCASDCGCGCDGAAGGECTCQAGCTCYDDADNDTTSNIWYNNNASPTINVGDIVIWTNTYSTSHTVTSDDGTSFLSGPLSSGDTFQHTFNSVGEFDYHCDYHNSMTGTITVIE